MSRTDLHALDDGALVAKLERQHHDLVKAQFSHSLNRLENTARLRSLRGAVARIETELRRREIAAGLPKNSLRSKHHVQVRGSGEPGESASPGFLAGVFDKPAE